jgi:D-beta-D-heptose 7-phosphate kinase/D-beta-D-heptose 1-phosphate adenosyltransferase
MGVVDPHVAASRPADTVHRTCIETARVFRHLHVLPGSETISLVEGEGAAIQSLDDLAATLERERRQGQCIILARGTFDILHAGHVHFLRAARRLGDRLVVAINGDSLLRRLGKRPATIDVRQRAALIAALAEVDHVVIVEDNEPAALIRRLRPAIYSTGADHAGDQLPEFDAVREVGGQLLILPLFAIAAAASEAERGTASSPGRR